jgi:AcrR family transcriptional regulator
MTGSRAGKAQAVTIEGRKKPPAPSLAQKTWQKRSELMVSELEAVALVMFEQHGFSGVNVEEIAAQARISTRTFYRYFPTKEDVLQVRIRREAEALRDALAERPTDEPPLHSLRLAVEHAVSAEDPVLRKRWIAVVAATPSALRAVLGGCILLLNGVLAEFFGSRLSLLGYPLSWAHRGPWRGLSISSNMRRPPRIRLTGASCCAATATR